MQLTEQQLQRIKARRDLERRVRPVLRERFGKRNYQITHDGNILTYKAGGREPWVLFGNIEDPVTRHQLGMGA